MNDSTFRCLGTYSAVKTRFLFCRDDFLQLGSTQVDDVLWSPAVLGRPALFSMHLSIRTFALADHTRCRPAILEDASVGEVWLTERSIQMEM